ncbi:MAG TPA: DUF6062 family protein [Methylomirabilota bacterium]|jgi:hypothetical protein|nr:DUF6062 family protein [Methylomirabilota bacterium]
MRRTENRSHPASAEPVDSGVALAKEIAERWRPSTDSLGPLLAMGECPLCRMLVQPTEDLMDQVVSAEQLPEPMRELIRGARGFCPVHAWRLFEAGEARGVPAPGLVRSIHGVLEYALSAMEVYGERTAETRLDPAGFKRTVRHGWTKRVARRLAPNRKCPFCLAVKLIEHTLGYQLIALLGRDEIRAGYRSHSALCLPHFRWALDAAGDKATLDCLVETERKRLRAVVSDRTAAGSVATLAHVVGVREAVTALDTSGSPR